jgi:phage-related protein
MEAAQKSAGFFGNALAVATGGLITSGIDAISSHFSDFISSGISDAQGAIGLMAQTQAVLTSTGNAAGVTAEHIAEYASSLSDATGKSLFGDDQIQQAENILLTFTNIKGAVLDDATAIGVDMAQALGGAPKDNAIQLGKALNDPIAGVSALTRVGVTFTDQQKEQIKAMQESGNMAGAQEVILKELNKEFGGSAEAAAGATGGIAQLKGMLGEFGESIGAAVLPGIQTLTGYLTSPDMLAAIQSVGDTIAHGVGDAMTWLSTTAIPALIAGWNTIAPTIGTVVAAFQDAASYIGTDGLGAALSTLGADLGELNPMIGSFIQSLAPLADTLMVVGQALLDASSYLGSDGFGAALSTMGADIAEVNPVLGAFIQALAPIGDALQTVSTSLANNGAQWAAIQATITQVSEGVNAVVMAVFGQITVFLQAHGTEIAATIQSAWTQIQGIIQTAIQIIQATIVPALAAIASFIQAHGTEIQAILSAVWTTISTIISTTLAVIQGVLTAVLQVIQGDWSGAWATIQATVQTVLDAISTIIQAQLSAIQAVMASVWNAIVSEATSIWNSLVSAVLGALDSMAQGVLSALDSMASTIYSTLNSVAGQATSQAASIGAGIIDGIRGAIMSKAHSIADAAADAVRDAIDAAKRAVGISSPSTMAADEVGAPIVEGIAVGMESESGNLNDTASTLVSDSVDAMADAGDTFSVGSAAVQDLIGGMAALMPDLQDMLDTISEDSQEAFTQMLEDINKLIEESFKAAIAGIDDISKTLSSAMSIWDQSETMDQTVKLTNDLGAAQQDYADTQTQIAQNEQAIADAKAEQTADEAQLATLTSQQAADLQMIQIAQDEYQRTSDDVTDIKQQQQDLQDEYNSGQIDQATYQAQSKELQDELNAALAEQQTAQDNLTSAQDQYDATTKSIADTQKQIDEDIQTQTDLQQQGVDLANQLAEQQLAITQAQVDLNNATALSNQLYAIQQAELAQLAQAQADAAKIADPKEAEEYLKIQTDYIQASADLQAQIAKAQSEGDDQQVALLEQQQALLDQQYQLQQQQLQYEMDTTQSTTEQVASSSDVIIQEASDTMAELTVSINALNDILNDMANAPGHASGTTSAQGGWSWVGEQGPELMYVPRGSGIYSNSDSMDMMSGGTTVNITVDARGASDPRAIEEAGYRGAKRALVEAGATAQIRKRAR